MMVAKNAAPAGPYPGKAGKGKTPTPKNMKKSKGAGTGGK